MQVISADPMHTGYSEFRLTAAIYLRSVNYKESRTRIGAVTRSKKKKLQNRYMQQGGKKDTKPVKEKSHHGPPRTALSFIVISVFLISVCLAWAYWPSPPKQPEQQTNTDVPSTKIDAPRAAILDGLYSVEPNLTLIDTLTNYLSDAGYRVDVYRGENVTIGLLRSIGGYKVLILRLHSTIHTDGFLYLFSGENYTASKYVDEQLTGVVKKAHTFDENESAYFALNAMFLGNDKSGGLNGSTIILTGCNGTGTPDVIQRLFERGAKAYVSWNGFVDLSHSDEGLLELVKALYAENLSIGLAVQKVMREVGPDPYYKSVLEYRNP
jgi:hypothetical protein